MAWNTDEFFFSTEIRKLISHLFRKGKKQNPQFNLTPFFIALFISFQSGSLSSATLWIIKNAFACIGLTAARSDENQKYLPSQATGPVLARI
jgi:hypothetical protein